MTNRWISLHGLNDPRVVSNKYNVNIVKRIASVQYQLIKC